MRKQCVGALALAALVLGGCGARPGGPAASGQEEAPLAVGTLRVELPRELDTAASRTAMERLPALLAEEGVAVEEVSVTFGTSYAATADALEGGGVDLAFLPAADYVGLCPTAAAILADGRLGPALDETAAPSAWNAGGTETADRPGAGTFALICAAPSAYGETLAQALAARAPTWEELRRARWGVLDEGSTAGYRCLELWLEDTYDGSGVADLDSVTVYDSWDSLVFAAAAEEIDLLPIPADLRQTCAARWTLETTRTDETGGGGFGREADIWTELPAVAVTEPLYEFVAAVTAENAAVNDPRFADALASALEGAFDGPGEQAAAIGAGYYVPIRPEDLDGLRRLEFGR